MKIICCSLLLLFVLPQVGVACDCDGFVNNVSYTLVGNTLTVNASKSYNSACTGASYGLGIEVEAVSDPFDGTLEAIGTYIFEAGAVPLPSVTYTVSDELLCSGFKVRVSQILINGVFSPNHPGDIFLCSGWVTVTADSGVDLIPPTAICQNVTVNLDITGNGSITPADVDNGSNDACDTDLDLSIDVTAYDCSMIGTQTVTLTAEDDAGNTATCTANVTVIDEIAPDPVCDQNSTTTLDANGFRTITASQLDSDSDDNCTLPENLVFSYSPTDITLTDSLFTCEDVGLNMVNIWVWDEAGNVSETCFAQLNVIDNTAPLCVTQDITVNLDDTGAASIVPADVDDGSSDACGIETMEVSPNTFDCTNLGDNTVTLTLTDVNGNVSTCDAIVHINDVTPPVAVCQDITVQLDASGSVTIVAADVDGGSSDECGIAELSIDVSDFDCSNAGPPADMLIAPTTVVRSAAGRTVTFTDLNLNGSGSSMQTVAPGSAVTFTTNWSSQYTSTFCPGCIQQYYIGVQNEDIDCMWNGNTASNISGSGSLSFNAPTTPGIYPIQFATSLQFSCTLTSANISAGAQDALGYIVVANNEVNLTVTDNDGNVSICMANVYVEDVTPPVAICADVTIQLNDDGEAILDESDLDGGSTDECGIGMLSASMTTFDCSNVGTNTVELTVYDVNMNSTTCSSTVTVQDNVDPNAICQDLNVYLDANGSASIGGTDVNDGSNDACGIDTMYVDSPDFTCTEVGANTVTLTVVDNSGNMSTCLSTVTVFDTISPIALCQTYTAQLDASGNVTIEAADVDGGSSDACGIDNLAIDIDAFDCTNVGPNDVVLTVTDVNGNMSSCTAVVTVEDNVDPTAICQDITIQLDVDGEVSIGGTDINNGSDDACGIDTMYVDIPDFTCDDYGDNTVTLTVVDNNGNEATCTSTVTVEDNVDPIAICQDSSLVLDFFDGTGSITAAELDGGSTDACGIAGFLVRRVGDVTFEASVDFDCDDVATPVAVEIQVEDSHGNTSICSSTVTLIDNSSPFLNCEDEVTVSLNSQGLGKLQAHTLVASWGADDPCGLEDPTIDGEMMVIYDCDDVGSHDVVVSISDVNGNITECTVTVEVVDQRDPECLTQPITVYLDATGAASIDSNAVDNGSYDNCDVQSINLDITSFSCADIGDPVTVTQTVLDVNGNSKTCTELVTVLDTISPICAAMDIVVQLDADGVVSIDSNAVDNGSNDACGVALFALDVTDFTCADVGSPVTVTQTVTDVNGNTSQCTAIVTVEDNVAPEALCQNVIIMLDASGNGALDPNDLDNGSNDACGIIPVTASQTAFDCSHVGVNIITLTVEDVNGNVSTCSDTVMVVDNVAPVALCQDVTIQLDASGTGTLMPSQVDAGSSDVCGIASLCIGKGLETSSIGGTLDTSDPIFIYDNSDPDQSCFDDPTIFNGCCNLLDGPHSYDQAAFTITAADTYTFTLTDINSSTDFMGVIYDSSFNPMDICANIIYGDDDSNPAGGFDPQIVISLTMAPGDYILITSTFGSGDDNFPAPYEWDITSAAGGTVSAFECASELDYTCLEVGENTVTLCATDVNGNVSYCSSTVTVEDNIAPTMVCQDITVILDSDGNGTIAPTDVDNGSSDNCSIVEWSVGPEEVGCEPTDFSEFTLLGDHNGHRYYASNNIMTWTEAYADAIEHGGNLAAISDAAENSFIATAFPDRAYIGFNDELNEGTFVWTTGEDNSYTSWLGGEPNNFGGEDYAEINFVANGMWNDLPTGVDLPYILEVSITGANEVSVVLIGTDQSGNEASCLSVATLSDITPPDVVCQNITVMLDDAGVASIDSNAIDNGSSDACGIASFTTSQTTFGCADVGDVSVVLTVTDNYGNTSICDATVTVQDNVAPVAICQDITVQLDFNGDVEITGAMIDNGSSDACGIASLTTSEDGSTFLGCENVGENTITLYVEDVNENVSTCTSTVTVEDNVAPLVNCVNNVEVPLNTDGIGFVTKEEVTGATFDACGVVDTFIIRNDVASHPDYGVENEMLFFDCSDIGLVDVIIRIYDTNGNVEECNTAVNVKDEILPTMECTSATIYLDESGVAALDSNALDNGSYDNCAIVEFSVSQTDFDCSHLGMNLIIMTAEDQSGNTNTCANGVMVLDTFAPVAMCKDIVVQLDDSGAATITGEMLNDGSTDACGPLTYSADITSFGCGDVGPNTVTMTVMDGSGNYSTCTSTVTVEDNVAPECQTIDITVQLDASGVASIDSNAVDGGSSDACGIASIVTDITDFTCADVGNPVTVTQTVTDVNGNESTCTVIVIVEDNVAPEALCQNVTVMLDASGNGTLDPNDLDNGSNDACGIIPVTASQTAFDCSHVGINIVTLTVEDVNGNISTCEDTVMVVDMVAPVALCQDVTIGLDVNGEATLTSAMVDNGSNDACGIANVCIGKGVETSSLAGTLELTDPVFVYDDSDPALSCFDDLSIFSGCCNIVDGTHHYDQQQFSISASDTYTFTFNSTGGDFIGIIYDSSFNPVDMCQNIIYGDDDAGSGLDPLIVITLTMVPGDYILVTSTWNTPSTLGIDYSWDITSDAGGTISAFECASELDYTCLDVGDNTVTLCATDFNGNVSYCSSTVTVEDNVDPTALCAAYTVQLDGTGSASIDASNVDGGSSDACGIASMSVSPSSFTCDQVGENTVTLTVIDNNGNESTCEATVTVEDNVAPTAICMNITVELGDDGTVSIDSNAVDGGSSDACGIASFSTDVTSFDCSNVGDNTVEMTVTDIYGNASNCTATVSVIDVTGPELTCPADIIVNTLPSDCNQNVIMPSLSPMDVCTGSATYEYSAVDITFINTAVDTFALFPVGDTEVTVIATDGFGNTSECTFNITVIDNVDPIIVGCDEIGDIAVDSDMTQCGANVTWDETLINANDNCSGQGAGVLITSDYSPGDLFPIGTTTVTYTATDNSNNTATCTFDVTVNPSLPVADFTSIATNLTVILTNESANATTYSWDFGDGNSSTDENPTHAYATAGTYTICLTVENACGDMDTYCEDITVADTGECLDIVALNAGWNLISFDVDPVDNTILTVFANEIASGNLNMITGFGASGALIYDPFLPPFLNTLLTIEPGYGYWVNVNDASSISLEGDCIDVDFKVDLNTGWNLVSYIPQTPTPPQVYFSTLITNGWLDLVTGYDMGSKIFDPSFPIPALNTLTDLENGFGYWVKVNTDVAAADWFKGSSNSSSVRDGENLDDWGNLRTSSYDFISGSVEGIQDGERVNVINEAGELVVELEVFQNGFLQLTPLYGDDSDTPDEIDGLVYDQTLYFEYEGIQSEVSIDFKGSSTVHFVELEFESSITSVSEITYDLSANVAPNPMFTNTTLSLEIPQSGNFTILLIDMTGKKVRSIHNGLINAGHFETTIERNDLIGGQYIISVMGDTKDSNARIPLLIIN